MSSKINSFHIFYFRFIHLYDEANYCIDMAVNATEKDKDLDTPHVVLIRSLPIVTSHIRICCSHPLFIFNITTKQCSMRPDRQSDARMIIDKEDRFDNYDTINKEDETDLVFGIPNCSHGNLIQKISREPFTLYNTGNIKLGKTIYNHNHYCISSLKSLSDDQPNWGHDAIIVRCEYSWRTKVVETYLTSALLLISDLFLIFLMIHVIKTQAHKLFGAMELSVIINLFIFNLTTTILKLWPESSYMKWPKTCITIGIVIQFTYLSFMFWINSLSFDVWCKFRRMRSQTPRLFGQTRGKLDGFKHPQYRKYAIFGWGIPLIIMGVTLLMQLLPPSATDGLTTPGLGEEGCFLRSHWAHFYYLYMIAGLALLINLCLFGMFMWNMFYGVWANKDLDRADMYDYVYHSDRSINKKIPDFRAYI